MTAFVHRIQFLHGFVSMWTPLLVPVISTANRSVDQWCPHVSRRARLRWCEGDILLQLPSAVCVTSALLPAPSFSNGCGISRLPSTPSARCRCQRCRFDSSSRSNRLQRTFLQPHPLVCNFSMFITGTFVILSALLHHLSSSSVCCTLIVCGMCDLIPFSF